MSKSSNLTPADAFVVTPSDTAPVNANGFYVGGTGNVTVVTDRNRESGVTTLFSALPVGTVIYLHVFRIMSTGTTATLITAFRD